MNQEQNNLSPNNLNPQGNNEPLNNQPLQNNQNVNNVSNQDMKENTIFNQQTFSTQPQPKMQPNDSLENEKTNNQNLNIKTPKKKNLGLIIGIVATIIVAAGGGIFLLSKNNGDSSLNFGGEKITKEDINNYNLSSVARWGNISLGISYAIPSANNTSLFSTNGSKSYSYLHGHYFAYSNDYYIYVEKSLEGNKNLDTLPIDINNEKNSEKYKYEYAYKATDLNEIVLTEKVVIDKLETIYFESNESDTRVLSGTSIIDAKAKYLGYSFKYGDSYYSIYGKIGYTEEESDLSQKELLKQYLHYVINSIEEYNNESFYELDNNFNLKLLFDGGSRNKSFTELSENEKQFVINHYGSHTLNGIYRSKYIDLLALDKDLINWDGNIDSIYNSVINSDSYTHNLVFINMCMNKNKVSYICSNTEILEETKETINGIEMKKYVIKYEFAKMIDYQIVYTFETNNNPYLFQFKLNSYYEESDNLTDEQKDILKNTTDIVASTLIRTIRFIEVDESLSEQERKYQYQNYIG